jgi:hypothetical protein
MPDLTSSARVFVKILSLVGKRFRSLEARILCKPTLPNASQSYMQVSSTCNAQHFLPAQCNGCMYRTSNPGQNTSIYIARHDYIPCAPTIYIASSKVSNKTMATRLCAGIYHSCPLLTLSFCAVDSSSFTLHNHTGDQGEDMSL